VILFALNCGLSARSHTCLLENLGIVLMPSPHLEGYFQLKKKKKKEKENLTKKWKKKKNYK
jgi:hypothetical protein